ncbi:probable peptidoglycan muropeptide transporter SLC46 [Ostrinia nubilalis]|uniref:probable peptidoglycan muropeptide transporter SLC46 n=1 Tax=Ostrinia nubilalis TaxID=29057 RepID=UPI0030824149
MTEGSVLVLHELEKLSPDSPKDTEPRKEEDNQKWQIILEPVFLGSMMAITLGQTSLQNFYLRTACTVDLGKNHSICDRGVGDEFRAAEAASQEIVAGYNVSRTFVGCFISTVVLMFVGPWSDCSGRRKPLLIMSLVGMNVMTLTILLLLTFPGAPTWVVLYAVQLPLSMGGNFGLLSAASFSYIGDVCHSTNRDVTRTMGVHRATLQVAQVVGSVSGPRLYRHLGFYGVFPLVLTLQFLSLVYVIWVVKDVKVNKENSVSVLDWRLPINAVKCLVRKREGYRRTIIIFMMIVALCDRMYISADTLLGYMYFRYKFHMDDILYGSYLAYKNVICFIGTLLILTVLKRRLRLSDEVVGALSCISLIISQFGLIIASSIIFAFAIPLVGIISQGSLVVHRPIINKQILPTEQGKIFGILGALESGTQTLSSPSFSYLYSRTVSTMPDAWLIPAIAMSSLQVGAYMLSKKLRLKMTQNTEEVPKKEVPLKNFNQNDAEKPLKENQDFSLNGTEVKS